MPLEELKTQLDFAGLSDLSEEEIWKGLLERHVTRLLEKLNNQARQAQILHAAGIQLPEDLVQYNYLLYLRQRSGQNGHLRAYEDYHADLAWQVLFASYAYHEPELQISDEELHNLVWERLKASKNLSEDTQALLRRIENSQADREAFLQAFLENDREGWRRSLQLERFDAWLNQRLGPPRNDLSPQKCYSCACYDPRRRVSPIRHPTPGFEQPAAGPVRSPGTIRLLQPHPQHH